MPSHLIRAEQHRLTITAEVRADMVRTVVHYRKVVRLLSTVIQTHWPTLAAAPSKCMAVEALCHPTARRPVVRYPMVARILGQMPSYLRRAAIEAAYGAVSSYLSNYANWLDKTPVVRPATASGKKRAPLADNERERGGQPPRLGFSHVYPSLYGGNMITEGAGLKTVRIKLLGADGQWRFTEPLRLRGKLKRLPHRLDLSPSLVLKGEKAMLICPVTVSKISYPKKQDVGRVCAVDVGINTAATAVIVDKTGTVIARTFLGTARHDGQRDDLHGRIAAKQSATNGKAGQGFCRALYRRIAGLSLDAARQLSTQLVDFARAHQAQAFVFEALKGWKPKGHGKEQRKRFHRFQHRALLKAVALRAEELRMWLLEVFAGGTSRWAYDGSGKVVRDVNNAQLATFVSGKQYDADLNGAQNIAARGLALLYGITNPRPAKVPGGDARMPLVLSDVWAWARASRAALTAAGVSRIDAPTTVALAT